MGRFVLLRFILEIPRGEDDVRLFGLKKDDLSTGMNQPSAFMKIT